MAKPSPRMNTGPGSLFIAGSFRPHEPVPVLQTEHCTTKSNVSYTYLSLNNFLLPYLREEQNA